MCARVGPRALESLFFSAFLLLLVVVGGVVVLVAVVLSRARAWALALDSRAGLLGPARSDATGRISTTPFGNERRRDLRQLWTEDGVLTSFALSRI